MLDAIEAIMKKLSIAICVFLYSLCVGCYIVPIPTGKHTPKEFNTRGEIDAKALEFMRVGSTSKEEVLLKLGEPDAAWKDERYFLYRWVTVSGYLLWGFVGASSSGNEGKEPLGKKRYDLLIEFDDHGVVKRLGDIETWAQRSRQKDRPLDLSTPIEIPVTHHHSWARDKAASLILGKDFFEFREPSHNFRISPEKIILLRPGFTPLINWAAGVFTYDIHFSEKTVGGEKIKLKVYIFELTTLFEYLRQNCPNIVVQKY